MKYLKYSLSCLIINNVLFSAEKDYLTKQDPSFEELRFVYQKNTLEKIFPWDAEKHNYTDTAEREALKEKLLTLNSVVPIPQQKTICIRFLLSH